MWVCMACTFIEGPIMKHDSYHRYHKREMMQDAFIVLAPPILTLLGVLWFFSNERVPTGVTKVLTSFVDSFFALLMSAV